MSLSMPMIITVIIAILISHHIFAFKLNLYKKAWEYASIGELISILKVVIYSILVAIIVQQILLKEIHFRLLAATWLLHILLISASRLYWRMHRVSSINKGANMKRTLIVGAGSAGTMVARQLLKSPEAGLLPVGFIDDDFKKQMLDIMGIPVVGGVSKIEWVAKKLNIDNIVLAIPSLSKKELNTIFQECAKTNANKNSSNA